MDRRRIYILIGILILIIFLSFACSIGKPSASSIETAIAQTQIAASTSTLEPTSTPIPLSQIDLESILLLPGDLPSDWLKGQVQDQIPKSTLAFKPEFRELPLADKTINLGIDENGKYIGDILILLYSSLEDRNKAIKIFAKYMENYDATKRAGKKTYPSDEVGEEAYVLEVGPFPFIQTPQRTAEVAFSKCHSVVYMSFFAAGAWSNKLIPYSQRLEKRLQPLVCLQ